MKHAQELALIKKWKLLTGAHKRKINLIQKLFRDSNQIVKEKMYVLC